MGGCGTRLVHTRRRSISARRTAASSDLSRSHSLTIATLTATDPLFAATVIQDADLTTRWDAPAGTGRDVQMMMTLKERSTIDAVQIDLGPYRAAYPRSLRVEVDDGSENLRTVWDGGTAGAAMLGVLSDARSATITLEVVPSAVGQKIVLTLPPREPSRSWSVADIRVLGR